MSDGRELYKAIGEDTVSVAQFGGCPACGSPNSKPVLVTWGPRISLVCEDGHNWRWWPGAKKHPARPIKVENLPSREGIELRRSPDRARSSAELDPEPAERQARPCDVVDSDETEEDRPSQVVAGTCRDCGGNTTSVIEGDNLIESCIMCPRFRVLPYFLTGMRW